jgi:hypothetical protein
MDFINPSAEKYVEKWDEEKQMYYYLVYFNKEENRKIRFHFFYFKSLNHI